MQNGLQLNPDKSEALIIGTTAQMKVLGVVLDRRITFEKQMTMVARSCHYHAQAIRHIRHLLSTVSDTGAQPDTDEAGLL